MDKHLVQIFHHWLTSPQGQALTRQEQMKAAPILANTFGYLALQVGLPHIDYLTSNRSRKKLIVSSQHTHAYTYKHPCIQAPVNQIPLEEQSVDVIVLPHTLEFSTQPEEILKEAHRILINEGQLLITGFNPWHIGMLRRLYRSHHLPTLPYQQFISITKIKKWFTLYGFEINRQTLHSQHWGKDGIFYILTARKRSLGMHLIGPAIKKKSPSAIKPAVAAQKTHKQ